MAEREGFEPPMGLHPCRISSAVHSTTLPPLRGAWSAISGAGAHIAKDGRSDKGKTSPNACVLHSFCPGGANGVGSSAPPLLKTPRIN